MIDKIFFDYYTTKNLALRNKIVSKYMWLVKKVISQARKKGCEPLVDKIQIGYIGLIKAAEKFDPFLGVQFYVYAQTWIKGELLHHYRDKEYLIRVPGNKHLLYRRIIKFCENDKVDYKTALKKLGIGLEEGYKLHTLIQKQYIEFNNEIKVNFYDKDKLKESEFELEEFLNETDKLTEIEKELILTYFINLKNQTKTFKKSSKLRQAIKKARFIAQGNKQCGFCNSYDTELLDIGYFCNNCKNVDNQEMTKKISA